MEMAEALVVASTTSTRGLDTPATELAIERPEAHVPFEPTARLASLSALRQAADRPSVPALSLEELPELAVVPMEVQGADT